MSTPSAVGLVGLGLMGSAMAHRLLDRGIGVVGHDPDPGRAEEHRARGGEVVDDWAAMAERVDLVLLSLPDSAVVAEVCLGDAGIGAHLRGGLVIDTTTSRPADCAATAAALAGREVGFVDACLSGTSSAAREEGAVVMVGGAEADVARARPVLDAIGRSVRHLGPVGSGSTAKLVVNLVLGLHRLALAEGLVLGERSGLDLDVLLDLLKDSAAYSYVMDGWGQRMVDADHDPPTSRIRQHAKDVSLITEQARRAGAPVLLAAIEGQLLDAAVASGLGDLDNSGVVEIVRRLAGAGRVEP